MRQPTDIILAGDVVFFHCLNPAVGRAIRVSKDYSWVDVKWMDGMTAKSGRYHPKTLRLANPVLTTYISEERPR